MTYLRRFSICQRIFYGVTLFSLLTIVIGVGSGWTARADAMTLQQLAQASSNTAPELASTMKRMASEAESHALRAMIAALAIGLVGIGSAAVLRASVKAPIEETIQSIIRMGGGDLESKIASPGRDEVSWMNAELNGMRKKLHKMVAEVRGSSESVLMAATEIAQGNTDLSGRTEGQAAALRQTSAAMNQLSCTVRANVSTADQAASLVSETNGVATRGGELMREVVGRMNDINGSAGRIVEIIQVIDGIAFQTNILALNAAVEAARAGDHGRGFAVVASEVRGLAQRCANAAREVKVLINDSASKVDAGTKLVGEAGQTMERIVAGVDKVSRLISDMAQAESAQSEGMAQVLQAVAQMDDMTERNASLVEQAAAAAVSLQTQSSRLTESVKVFRIAA